MSTSNAPSTLDPRQLEVVERWTMILACVAIAGAMVAAPRAVAAAVAAGAVLMVANAYAIRKLAGQLARGGGERRAGLAVILFNVKMFALMALVYVAVKTLALDAIGFLVGVSIFPLAIVITALRFNAGPDVPDLPDPNGTDERPHGSGSADSIDHATMNSAPPAGDQ